MMDFKLNSTYYDLSIVNGGIVPVTTSDEVSQNVAIRLQTYLGEWFLDTNLGLPWYQNILGGKDVRSANLVIRNQIVGTTGVSKVETFNSLWATTTRQLSLYATISTIYGDTSTVSVAVGG